MKLSRDQKYMLIFGAMAALGIFAFWAASQFKPAEISAMSDGVRGAVYIFLGVLGLILAVLITLLPVFVYYIYSDVRKMREIAERNERKLEQMRVDFATLRQMWQKSKAAH